MKRHIALLLLFSLSAQAEVKYLDKGAQTPFPGFLFDGATEQRARACEQRRLLCQQANAIQDDMLKQSTQQANLYRRQSEDMSQRISEASGKSFWSSALYFGLGVAATGAAVALIRK